MLRNPLVVDRCFLKACEKENFAETLEGPNIVLKKSLHLIPVIAPEWQGSAKPSNDQHATDSLRSPEKEKTLCNNPMSCRVMGKKW